MGTMTYTSEELQRSVDHYGESHRLAFDANSDTECTECGWAGCLLTPLPATCDAFKWPESWVYCSQHLAAHVTGWCTVSLRDKTLLEANGHVQAIEECRARGFRLFHDSQKGQ